MAINLTDFDKIWASSSPLTPYSFSDANYEEGWNFVGATPPSRQMWDSFFKWSDEKQQYIVQNFLPLSGGTMVGTISTSYSQALVKTNSDGYIQVNSGVATADGSSLVMCAKGYTGVLGAGAFQLTARDSNDSKTLHGKPDGTLIWGGNTIPTKNVNIQAGKTASTNVDAGDSVAIAITFSPAFSFTPIVLATVQTNYKGFYAAVGSITTSGASITLNNTSGTARSVTVGWMAISI